MGVLSIAESHPKPLPVRLVPGMANRNLPQGVSQGCATGLAPGFLDGPGPVKPLRAGLGGQLHHLGHFLRLKPATGKSLDIARFVAVFQVNAQPPQGPGDQHNAISRMRQTEADQGLSRRQRGLAARAGFESPFHWRALGRKMRKRSPQQQAAQGELALPKAGATGAKIVEFPFGEPGQAEPQLRVRNIARAQMPQLQLQRILAHLPA